MAVDYIRYDILAQDALRGVVRTVLVDAAKKGLPGDHHFYITFDTRADGVRLSQRMLAQYPEEMTVVLQHQFWDLVVSEEGFEVGLSFGGVPERLTVPFTAIKAFVDPAVQFALQFEEIGGEAESESSAGATPRRRARQADERRSRTARPVPKKIRTGRRDSAWHRAIASRYRGSPSLVVGARQRSPRPVQCRQPRFPITLL